MLKFTHWRLYPLEEGEGVYRVRIVGVSHGRGIEAAIYGEVGEEVEFQGRCLTILGKNSTKWGYVVDEAIEYIKNTNPDPGNLNELKVALNTCIQ